MDRPIKLSPDLQVDEVKAAGELRDSRLAEREPIAPPAAGKAVS